MTPILVDTCVFVDIAQEDPTWYKWSSEALERFAEESTLVINPIIFAEVSAGFSRVEDVEAVFPRDLYQRETLPYAAAFLAGRAFYAYKRNRGTRSSTLPDFFIGAHAAVCGYRLLTRDTNRYRTYFPTVELIAP